MAKSIEFEVKIKGDSGVLKSITVEAVNADAAIDKIVESATRATDKLRRMAESGLAFTTLKSAIETANGAIQRLAAPFNSFEDSMAKVNTMAGKNADGLDYLTDKVQDLSEVVPLAREAIADGLYQTISAGVPEAQWLDYLNASARSAVGGCADLGGVVKVTSGIIKAYGADWSDAGAIQDKIQKTAKLGVTSFEELSQALPRVTGNAATLGVTVDELMSVFATTTNVTGNTAEVSTQLAAVLNSLVKPSSEAQKAAQAMGISFDAASVKSAGGLQNFLLGLDLAVQEYSAKTGQLSETIYGQLFGSAEALRLLGSLTGEQKTTFAANIGAMVDSAGSIDEAFENMASTGNAQAMMFNNLIAGVTSWAGSVVSAIGPQVELVANIGEATTTAMQLGGAIKVLASWLKATRIYTLAAAAAHKVAAATSLVWHRGLTAMNATFAAARARIVAMTVATKGAIVASSAWKVVQMALNIVLSANPIGIVVMAIAALVAAVVYAYNNCEEFREICDQVWAVIKKVAVAVWDWLVKAFNDCCEVVKAAWEWVKKFFGFTDTSPIENQTAALDANTDALNAEADAKAREALASMAAKDAADWQTMSYDQLGQAIENVKTKLSQLAGTDDAAAKKTAALLRQMQARYKQLGKSYGLTDTTGKEFDGKSLIANATTYKELGNNIQYYQNKLEKTKPSETDEIARLSKLIVAAKKAQESIEGLQAAASRPVELKSLGDYEEELQYLTALRSKAETSAEIGVIDARIKELTKHRDAMEAAAFKLLTADQIKTYGDIEEQMSHYEDALKTASATERIEIQKQINELEKLKAAWDNMRDAVGISSDPAVLKTSEEVAKALAYYTDQRDKASADEVDSISATIYALKRKAEALQKLADLGDVKAQSADLASLGKSELKMRVRLMGADEVQKTLALLRAQLANPALSEADRKELEELIEQWQGYASMLKNQMTVTDAVSQSMGNMSSMLGSVAKMTDESTAKMLQWGAQTLDACSKAFTAIMAVAAGKAAESVADVPVVGWILAGTAIASVLAAFASIPKFADGGIAYGPTLGLFGEYAGAANNPEVVAPLDRLRSLIAPAGGAGGEYKTISVEIPGRKLVALLKKETAFSNKR